MSTVEKLTQEIKKARTLKESGMSCQQEVDRLTSERDKLVKKDNNK